MSERIYEIGGVRYLTSTAVAELLGVSQRAVLRWPIRIPRKAPLLKKLVWVRDPLTRRVYFREDIILELKKYVLTKRRVRIRR